MKNIISVISLSLIASTPVLADEVEPPIFDSPPIEYIKEHKIAFRWDNNRQESVTDTLLIGDENDKGAKIYIETISNNYHTCSISGKAEKNGDLLVYTYKKCKIHIKNDNAKAKTTDINNKCGQYFCGKMGSLNATFNKK